MLHRHHNDLVIKSTAVAGVMKYTHMVRTEDGKNFSDVSCSMTVHDTKVTAGRAMNFHCISFICPT